MRKTATVGTAIVRIQVSPAVHTDSKRSGLSEKNETTNATSHTPDSATSRIEKGPTPYCGGVWAAASAGSSTGASRSASAALAGSVPARSSVTFSSSCSSVTMFPSGAPGARVPILPTADETPDEESLNPGTAGRADPSARRRDPRSPAPACGTSNTFALEPLCSRSVTSVLARMPREHLGELADDGLGRAMLGHDEHRAGPRHPSLPRSGANADWACRFRPSSRRETRPRTTRIESATSIDWNSV